MKKRNWIISGLIILSGTFFFSRIEDNNRFDAAQIAFFIFSGFALGSILLYEKNKWVGIIAGICAFGFIKTLLLQHAPSKELFSTSLVGISIFLSYYAARQLNFKEDKLKLFLIPAVLNIALIFAQRLDHNFLPFMPVNANVTGFLGLKSFSAVFLGMCTPLFWKHLKWGLPFSFIAIMLCNGTCGFVAAVTSSLFYLFFTNRRMFKVSLIITLVAFIAFIPLFLKSKTTHLGELRFRLSAMAGTIHGCMYNPIFGWGIGSFLPVVEKIPPEESVYLGVPFNTKHGTLNHPHNELIMGWWNMGAAFPIMVLVYLFSLCRKFTVNKVLPFSIALAGVISAMGIFLTEAAWFLLAISLGINDNKEV